jgi:hypothetical protein
MIGRDVVVIAWNDWNGRLPPFGGHFFFFIFLHVVGQRVLQDRSGVIDINIS